MYPIACPVTWTNATRELDDECGDTVHEGHRSGVKKDLAFEEGGWMNYRSTRDSGG
jgi:hypothetical protein